MVFDVDVIPVLNPPVENILIEHLRKEVAAYSRQVQGKICLLCPFRRLSRTHHMRAHLKYHSETNMFMADGRSPQGAVIRAYFDYCQATKPVAVARQGEIALLQHTASLMRTWNNRCTESSIALLAKTNRPVLVRVLTHTGPEYWAKSLTESCMRHSREIYYTSRFADLFLSILLTNEARVGTSVDALYLHFGSTSETSSLLPKNKAFWNDLMRDITSHKVFKAKIRSLKWKVESAGELQAITYDETFKTLFSLIGQKIMSQADGELHALHTFRGFTGCTLGVSAQRSTSGDCFRAAAEAIFVDNLADKVIFLFSDCPNRIHKAAHEKFKSLVGLGEDALHLAIRLECCWGEKKTKPSVRVRQLHRKFSYQTLAMEHF